MKKHIGLVYFVSIVISSFSQEYKFDHITQKDGLSNPFINCIEQDDNGLLLVGTGEGVGLYNGVTFKMFNSEDRLAEDFVSTCYKDSRGKIWLGHKNGGVSFYDDNSFDFSHTGEGINSMINSITEDNQGRIWFATQRKGLFYINKDNEFKFFQTEFSDLIINSLTISQDNLFFISTDIGVKIYSFYEEEGILTKEQDVVGIPQVPVKNICKISEDKFVVATMQSGLFLISEIDGFYQCDNSYFDNLGSDLFIRDIDFYDNYLYISTFQQGVFKASIRRNEVRIVEKYNESSGLKTNNVNKTRN